MTSAPRHIIISHVYSHANKGDAALTSVLIRQLRLCFPNAQMQILTLESAPPGSSFEGVPEQSSFMHHALNKYRRPWQKLAYVLYMVPATLAWAMWRRWTGRQLYLPADLRRIAEAYAAADLVVPVGGGYIRSREGVLNRLNIPLLLHPLLFGRILGKPTVLYSQSIGPFVHRYEAPLVAFVLKRMNLVMLREDTSRALLEKMGVSQNVVRTVDAGFLFCSDQRAGLRKVCRVPRDKLLVGVTVRSWLPDRSQAVYENAVAKSLDNLIKIFKARVVFIPQVTAGKGDDDRAVSRRVYDRMEQKRYATVIDDDLDHYQVKAAYGELDALLGTRFHSVIFSLTSFVPVLAIEYEHKTSGIMHDLQLNDWVVDINGVTEYELTRRLCDLIRGRRHYRAQLRRQVPPYIRRAGRTIRLLAEIKQKEITADSESDREFALD